MPNEPRRYESLRELEARTGIAAKTIHNRRWRGEGPPAYKVGNRLLFVPEEVDAWIAANGESPAA